MVAKKCGRASSSKRPISDHYDGERFYNPTLSVGHTVSLLSGLKILLEKRSQWPSAAQNSGVPRLHEKLGPDDIAVTFVSHATFVIQMHGITILTDPIWSRRASPVSWLGPERIRHPGVEFDDLPPIDLVLISHNHYDHLDIATLKRLNERFAPVVLVPIGDKELVKSIGIKNVHELDWWDEVHMNPNLTITFAPTQHFSARSLWDRQKSLWGSYMIRNGERRVYFCGDSGYASHFSEIRKRLGPPDIALLSIGAYEPRWFMKPMHMNPAEAIQAHEDLGAKQSIGMHFGTFQLSTEALDQPKEELKAALLKKGICDNEFILLQEGETRIYRSDV